MYNEDELCSIREAEAECEETKVSPTRERFGERKDQFSSDTDGIDVDRLYTPADIATHSYKEDSGFPGQEPYGVFIQIRGDYPRLPVKDECSDRTGQNRGLNRRGMKPTRWATVNRETARQDIPPSSDTINTVLRITSYEAGRCWRRPAHTSPKSRTTNRFVATSMRVGLPHRNCGTLAATTSKAGGTTTVRFLTRRN